MQNNNTKVLLKTNNLVYKIALVGILSALSYIGTFIHIPIPSLLGRPMIHLGNLVVIISALIFNGFIGGLSGAIGMGLYDFIGGYDLWSITRTIVLKLLMGLIVGFVYQTLIKKEKARLNIIMFILGSILLIVGITFLIVSFQNGGNIVDQFTNKKEAIHWPVYTFSIVNGVFLIILGIINHKIPFKLQVVSTAATIAIMVNIMGEFIYKVLKQLILGGSSFVASVYTGFLSLPATLLNATITLGILLLIFIPIENALSKVINR